MNERRVIILDWWLEILVLFQTSLRKVSGKRLLLNKYFSFKRIRSSMYISTGDTVLLYPVKNSGEMVQFEGTPRFARPRLKLVSFMGLEIIAVG
jgi:hypothetical protein